MKQCFFCFLLVMTFAFYVSCDRQIAKIQNNANVLVCGVLEDKTPILIVEEFKNQDGASTHNKSYFLVIGDKKTGPFEEIGNYVFSSDGQTLNFTAKLDNGWYLYANKEQVAGPFNLKNIKKMNKTYSNIKVSPVVKDNFFSLVIDEKIKASFDLGKKSTVSLNNHKPFVFPRDYLGDSKKQLIYLDGNVCVGSICGEKIVYVEDNKIYIRQ